MKEFARHVSRRSVVVFTMLAVLLVQAAAFAPMACEMSATPHSAHASMEHPTVDHSSMQHDHGAMAAVNQHDSADTHDCCALACTCPSNTCTSGPFLSADLPTTIIDSATSPIASAIIAAPTTVSTFLFRPPILA